VVSLLVWNLSPSSGEVAVRPGEVAVRPGEVAVQQRHCDPGPQCSQCCQDFADDLCDRPCRYFPRWCVDCRIDAFYACFYSDCTDPKLALDDRNVSDADRVPVDPDPDEEAIGACETCSSPDIHCTPCCHACKLERCYDTCRDWPRDCDLCEEDAYWDCVMYECRDQE
jgi:hypothetical protein